MVTMSLNSGVYGNIDYDKILANVINGIVSVDVPTGSNQIKDITKSFIPNQLTGSFISITYNIGSIQGTAYFKIISNTTNTITIDGVFPFDIKKGSKYTILLTYSSVISSPLTPSGNLKVGILEDVVNLAKELTLQSIRDLIRPISKANVFNTAVTANANILAGDITPTNAPTLFRIYATFSASGVFSVKRSVGATTVTENMNQGNALVANASYIFDIMVDSGESINFIYSVNATCLKLSVVEIDAMR